MNVGLTWRFERTVIIATYRVFQDISQTKGMIKRSISIDKIIQFKKFFFHVNFFINPTFGIMLICDTWCKKFSSTIFWSSNKKGIIRLNIVFAELKSRVLLQMTCKKKHAPSIKQQTMFHIVSFWKAVVHTKFYDNSYWITVSK